jgi:hypothetical protein
VQGCAPRKGEGEQGGIGDHLNDGYVVVEDNIFEYIFNDAGCINIAWDY